MINPWWSQQKVTVSQWKGHDPSRTCALKPRMRLNFQFNEQITRATLSVGAGSPFPRMHPCAGFSALGNTKPKGVGFHPRHAVAFNANRPGTFPDLHSCHRVERILE